MKFPVIAFALTTLATAMVVSAHSQPYPRPDPDRAYSDRYNDRNHGPEAGWEDRWRWRCERDPEWCRRLCWRDEYNYLRCRHDDDDRYDWRDYWLYHRSYQDYYGRHR